VIYLDASALVKLVLAAPETGALTAHLDSSREPKISTELAGLDVRRMLIRANATEDRYAEADRLLASVARLPVGPILEAAARLPEPHLRSLDAIHLATAQLLGPAVTQFITYDHRLGKAALDAGLPVITPGTN
jgi:predicted nucleic acid-binding protein